LMSCIMRKSRTRSSARAFDGCPQGLHRLANACRPQIWALTKADPP
jgi:hypothetical protein